MRIDCPYCRSPGHNAEACTAATVTADQQAYMDRILADSDAVYRQEHRAFQAQRKRPREPLTCP